MATIERASVSVPQDLWGAGRREIHLSGTQAVIRFLVEALRADRDKGLKTAAFVSGYQGSPLGGFDLELERAMRSIDVEIVHEPGINEELGATAVMGSQAASLQPSSSHDGVIGVWYGKTPGLDRAADALRHASYAGASAHGGVLILVGDDPMAKSSTLPSSSEGLLAELWIPVLYPRNLTEVIELGRHGIEMSRLTGAPVALKLVSVIADAEGTAAVGTPFDPIIPEGLVNPGVSSDLLTPATLVREPLIATERLAAAARYGEANGLNRPAVRPAEPVVCLVAAGTTFSELREALLLIGLDERAMLEQGVELVELSMPFPLGAGVAAELSRSVDVVVVEERREVIEHQILSLLGRSGSGPRIWGKAAPTGEPFIPASGTLTPDLLARILHPMLQECLEGPLLAPPAKKIPVAISASAPRTPWYCSGCPHSVSTAVPDGRPVGIGIGCHSITTYMPEERVGRSIGITQMGGEGAQWVGMSRFVDDEHIFQNLGDSTFFHSGHLAIRSAVASGVSITYKILWNGVSAMTGGQHPAGGASLATVAQMLLLEGVAKVVITTDDVARTKAGSIPRSVEIRDRDEVLDVQRELASVSGVTVMIHDQACATELRRARKRGLVAPPRQVVVINERVCEGCGDCQTKSNCLSLQTISTPFGPKTTVDEETCNVDLSCLAGDCPAFALVEPSSSSGSTEASSTGRAAEAEPALAPEAPVRSLEASTTVRLAGVGGTGVVTAAHLLARAALIDGVEAWGVDQTGMSQKAGTVISDLRIGPGAVERSNVLGTDEVDVLVACDLLAATARACLDGLSPSRTRVVGSTATSLTGPMVLGRTDRSIDTDALCAALEERAIPDGTSFVDTEALLGRAGISRSASNVALLGIVHQSGLLPLSTDALRGAIEQNGVAVEENLSAFELGRAWAAGLVALEAELEPLTTTTAALDLPDAARAHLGALADELVQYQSPAQAAILLERAEAAWRVEALLGGDGTLCTAVADGLFKFQAYKDEYEVARLLLDHPASGGKVTWLLHPPAMRSRGLKRKLHLGPRSRPLLRALKAGRRLRGTRLDPFGRTPLRRLERQLIDEQLELIDRVLGLVDAERLAAAAELCRLPLEVRGYESVKERSIERFVSKRDQLLAALEAKVLIDERSA